MIRISAPRLAMLGAAIALIALALAACAPAGDDSALMTGRVWKATQVCTTEGLTSAPSAGGPTSEFVEGRVSGTTGVNRYSGEFETKSGGKVRITVGPMTLMAGSPEAMALEQAFIEAMKSATHFSVTETELTLQDDGGNVLVSYQVLKEPPPIGVE